MPLFSCAKASGRKNTVADAGSVSLVLWIIVMKRLTLSPEEIGVKGESGIRKNEASRKAFLTDPIRRIRFIYVPKHSSWLNQVEI